MSLIYRIPVRRLMRELDAGDVALLAAYDRKFGLPDAWDMRQAAAVINLHNAFADKRGKTIDLPVERKPMAASDIKASLKAMANRKNGRT